MVTNSALQLCAITLTVLCYFIGGVQAQTQVPNNTFSAWNPGARCVSREDYLPQMNELCRGYIPDGQSIYIDDLQPYRETKLAERILSIVSRNYCILKQIQIYCAESYRPCYNVSIPGYGYTAVAGFLCFDFCEVRTNACFPVYEAFGAPYSVIETQLSCTTPYSYDFGYPNAAIFVGDGATNVTSDRDYNTTIVVWEEATPDVLIEYNVTLPCYDANSELFGGWPVNVCPDGLYSVSNTVCAFNCPEPLVSDPEYDAAVIVFGVIGWISFVLCAFLVVSYLIDPKEKMKHPRSLTFFFIVCVMCLSWTWCLGIMVGRDQMWCSDNTPNRWGNGWCTIQGITYVYFTLAGGLWWLSIGFTLLLSVAINYKPQDKVVFVIKNWSFTQAYLIEAGLHLFCWGIPLVVVIICLSAHKIGYGGSDFWCSIHSGEEVRLVQGGGESIVVTGVTDEEQVDIWNLFLLTIPMLLISITGCVVLFLVVIFAWVRSKEGWKFLLHQWRLLALMLLYIWIYAFVFSHHIAFTASRHDQYDEYSDYVTCLKSANVLPIAQKCYLHSTVSYPLWFIAAFNAAAQGIFIFFIYGTARGVYQSWVKLFRKIPGFPTGSSSSSAVTVVGKVAGNSIVNDDNDDEEDNVEMEPVAPDDGNEQDRNDDEDEDDGDGEDDEEPEEEDSSSGTDAD